MDQGRQKSRLTGLILWPVYGFGCVAVGAFGADALSREDVSPIIATTYRSAAKYVAPAFSPACNIKGNVSINTQEKIYHVPGQKFYARTRINPFYGERWFCTEEDAQAAGWRRAYR